MSYPLYAPPRTDYSQELSDVFHTELFSSSSFWQSSGSRESTSHAAPQAFFPAKDGSPAPSFLNLINEDIKTHDTLESGGGPPRTASDMLLSGAREIFCIDPQLIVSPAQVRYAGFGSDSQTLPRGSSGSGSQAHVSSAEELTMVAAVKVGGHGKARKGTVASGGISKKVVSSSASAVRRVDFSPTDSLAPVISDSKLDSGFDRSVSGIGHDVLPTVGASSKWHEPLPTDDIISPFRFQLFLLKSRLTNATRFIAARHPELRDRLTLVNTTCDRVLAALPPLRYLPRQMPTELVYVYSSPAPSPQSGLDVHYLRDFDSFDMKTFHSIHSELCLVRSRFSYVMRYIPMFPANRLGCATRS
ncbi:hypothetical protein C8R43DRAFT_1005408 [Mycena crocata]|nr:hypothetical protein C8R43DRAFT_1005408 [Mycena crocata]